MFASAPISITSPIPSRRTRRPPGDDTVAAYVLSAIRYSFGGVEGGNKGDIIRQLRSGEGATDHRRPLNGALYWLTCAGRLKYEEERRDGEVVWRAYRLA